jgi:hypothetical protein
MSNLTALAFPFIEPSNHENGSVSTGFTKHELAAIIIASQLASQTHYREWKVDHLPLVADKAFELAKLILSKF